MTRCPEECGKQWRLVQGENQDGKNRRKKKQKKKLGRREKKKGKTMKVKKIVEEWEIWDKEEAVAKLEVEAKKNGARKIPSVD